MITIYESRNDAIQREIVTSLGEYAGDFDTDAIADVLLVWDNTRRGFRVDEDADFWAIVQTHEVH